MIAVGVGVRVICTACHTYRDIDIEALRKRVGGDFSLFNRRCRCRLSPGCEGWNRFFYLNGRAWPMWDEDGAKRFSAALR